MNNILLHINANERIDLREKDAEFVARASAVYLWRKSEIDKINKKAEELLEKIKIKCGVR